MPTTNSPIPEEFYTSATFFTLSGAAGAVWLFCLVLANFDPNGAFFTPLLYRIIAISLSLLIAIIILLRKETKKSKKKPKKFESWLITFFNGILIFVNASGLNAVTSNSTFENMGSVVTETQEASLNIFKNVPFFKNEVFWWEDYGCFTQRKELLKENEKLVKELAEQAEQSKKQQKELEDNLTNTIKTLEYKIKRFEKEQVKKQAQLDRCQDMVKKLLQPKNTTNKTQID